MQWIRSPPLFYLIIKPGLKEQMPFFKSHLPWKGIPDSALLSSGDSLAEGSSHLGVELVHRCSSPAGTRLRGLVLQSVRSEGERAEIKSWLLTLPLHDPKLPDFWTSVSPAVKEAKNHVSPAGESIA